MAKIESSFKNMVCSLVTISVVAAAALSGVYLLTKDKIEKQKEEKEQRAINEVLPKIDKEIVVAPADTVVIKDAKGKDKKIVVYRAYLKEDSTYVGAAVKTFANGFGGKQKIMVGFDKDTMIVNYTVLEHQETPGLGDKITFWFNDTTQRDRCILGRKVSTSFKVKKDNGEIDAITAATISSKAFLDGVKDAYVALGGKVEATTGASEQAK